MKINGKTYKIPEMDFNMICDLEEAGVSILELDEKPISSLRGFLSVIGEMSLEEAGNEIQEHLMKDGSIDEIVTEVMLALVNSGFFQALLSPEEKKNMEKEVKEMKETLKK